MSLLNITKVADTGEQCWGLVLLGALQLLQIEVLRVRRFWGICRRTANGRHHHSR